MMQKYTRVLIFCMAAGAMVLRAQDGERAPQGNLRLPDAVINIEDKSEMDLDRQRAWYKGADTVPEIERNADWRERLHAAGRLEDTAARDGNGAGPGPGRETTPAPYRRVSNIRLSYGLRNTLDAYIASGQEIRGVFFQAAYERFRSDSVATRSETLPNSPRQKDALYLDLGWSLKDLDLSANLRFYENLEGLQTNEQFSQSRKNGVAAAVRGESFLGADARFRFGVDLSGGNQVLDNPAAQHSTDTVLLAGNASLVFYWPEYHRAEFGMSFLHEAADDTAAGESAVSWLSGFLRGRLGFGILRLHAGSDFIFASENPAFAAPYGRVVLQPAENFSLSVHVRRSVSYPVFKTLVIDRPYSYFEPEAAPELGLSLGAALDWHIAEAMRLSVRFDHYAFERLYYPLRQANGLYSMAAMKSEYLKLEAELRVQLGSQLRLDTSLTGYGFSGERVPYLPGLELSASMQWTLPRWKTILSATARFVGALPTGTAAEDLPPVVLLDATIQQPLSGYASLFVKAENILQAEHQVREGFYEAGFSFHTGLQFRF